VNRLDRLTSGLLIVPLSSSRAAQVSEEFVSGKVRKEYVARVKGEFSAWVFRRSQPKEVGLIKTVLYHSDEVVCEKPLITVDRQMGLNIVHPEGKVNDAFCSQVSNSQRTTCSLPIACKNSVQSPSLRYKHRY
jgi:tRNA pseudouridine synthase 9